MRESILTIPINEVFEPRDGCPLCTMRDMLENRCVEYIMGAAMMEPDVRIETNHKGFCHDHYPMLLQQKNRLGLGLILQSHITEIREKVLSGGFFTTNQTKIKKAAKLNESCFVCDKVDWGISHLTETVYTMYAKDRNFRKLYSEQEFICMNHYQMLYSGAEKVIKLNKAHGSEFLKMTTALTVRHLELLQADIDKFCSMFDYRNSGKEADWGNSKDAIERTLKFLTTREMQ